MKILSIGQAPQMLTGVALGTVTALNSSTDVIYTYAVDQWGGVEMEGVAEV